MKSYRGYVVRDEQAEARGDRGLSLRVLLYDNGVVEDLKRTGRAKALAPYWFAWGDTSPGSLALAHSILCDATGTVMIAERFYAKFCGQVVARMQGGQPWVLHEPGIAAWLKAAMGDEGVEAA